MDETWRVIFGTNRITTGDKYYYKKLGLIREFWTEYTKNRTKLIQQLVKDGYFKKGGKMYIPTKRFFESVAVFSGEYRNAFND